MCKGGLHFLLYQNIGGTTNALTFLILFFIVVVAFVRYQVGFRSLIPTQEVEKTTKELELFVAQVNDLVLPDSMPK